jgi:hypothetical protein
MATPRRDDDDESTESYDVESMALAHTRVDLGGTVVLLGQTATKALQYAMQRVRDNGRCSLDSVILVDLFGAPCELFLQKIESISHITPESRACAREWNRRVEEAVDKIDPEGAGGSDRPW